MEAKDLRKISMVLIIAVLLLWVVGCTSSTQESNPPEAVVEDEVKDEVAEEVEETEVEEGPIVIIDHLGREVKFDMPAQRIVSSYYIPTSMLLALGLKDKVVGIEAKANTRPIYELAAPEFLGLPSVGTMKEFDLEGTAALEPDLVIMSVRLKDAVESLEKLGIKVIAINPEDMQLLNESLHMIAKATGRGDRVKKLIDYIDEKTAMVENLVKNEEKKDVYLGGNSDFLLTASSKMYQHTLIETAGGKNVAGDIDDTYWADISYEQLIAYNPDIILGVPGTSYTKEDIMEDQKLRGITAVDNSAIYFMPSGFESWDSPIPSGVLGTLWLTSVLHEDVYSFDEFKEDAFYFYKEFFGIEINKDDITK
ncbi:MAG: ABC transporter substrate-binding protein [Tissierellia bacterium]|nr:ABC transporter substrate-binding protein [Tissierellia bacterium]